MEPIFREARQNRVFEDVVDQIEGAIIDGRLKTGDRLPAERDLKAMLKTSRSTLREALRVLEQKGLIEIKLGTGGGARVKSVSSDQVTESLDLLIRSHKVSLDHLAEFRESIEGDVVALAARRAVPAQIARLKALLKEAGEHLNRGPAALDRFVAADKTLHLAFADISGNPVFITILRTIHDNIHRYYERLLVMKPRDMVQNFTDLEKIVQAVEQGRADRARMLARAHVRRFNRYMQDDPRR